MRKSEWTLLAFDDGSKLFVATRDLSPTIFHFKEKWKQLFDLGILRGCHGKGWGEGERSVGKVGEVRAIKIKEQRPREGWGRGWDRQQRTRGVSEELRGACVCVCVSESPSLSLSIQIRIRGFLLCVLKPWAAEGVGGGETGEGKSGEGEGHPQPGPWLAQLHRSVWEGAGGSCRSRV